MKSKRANAIVFLAASWIALVAGLALADEMDETDSPEIEFLWCDAHQLHLYTDRVAKEVRGTFEEMGIKVAWGENEEGFAGSASAIQLRVVVLPSEPGGASWNLSPNVSNGSSKRLPVGCRSVSE